MSAARLSSIATIAVMPIMVGGCSASMQSICALQATRYTASLRRHGLTFARNPRHADVLLLAGPVTSAARQDLGRLLASVPEPRVIVAVGNCAIDGCIFASNRRLVPHAANAHVEIAGCPPTPDAILSSILTAKHLLLGESHTPHASDEADTAAAATHGDDEEALILAREQRHEEGEE